MRSTLAFLMMVSLPAWASWQIRFDRIYDRVETETFGDVTVTIGFARAPHTNFNAVAVVDRVSNLDGRRVVTEIFDEIVGDLEAMSFEQGVLVLKATYTDVIEGQQQVSSINRCYKETAELTFKELSCVTAGE